MKTKILVVDDEEMVREAIASVLEDAGYSVERAGSGEEGAEAARAGRFDLVFLDLRMEPIGGLETLRRIKARDPSLPVIILTGDGTVETAKEALRMGAADYLCKPAEPAALIETARRHARTADPDPHEKVLVVDDDPQVLESTLAVLEEAEIPAEGFGRADQALLRASRGEGSVLLTDLKLADGDGLRLVERLREARPDLVPILMTGFPSVATTVQALRRGAVDYLQKPVPPEALVKVVQRALARRLCEHLPGDLRPGRAYGVVDPGRARGLFSALVGRGLRGLWIGREPPPGPVGPGVSAYRLGNSAAGGLPPIPPDPERLAEIVEGACKQERTAVLIEPVEYLAAQNGFETTFRAVTVLRDIAEATGSVLLLSFNPAAFTGRERSLLARELEVQDGPTGPERWEAAARRLAGDQRTLYELLRAAGGRKHQSDLVAATGFSKARVSRILDRMEQGGLLRRQRDGMGNLVVLA